MEILSFKLHLTDKSMLSTVTQKMGKKSNSETLRTLIRAAYSACVDQPKTKLSKVEKFVPGQTNYMKFDMIGCIAAKGTKATKLFNRIKRKNAIKNKTKLSSLNGQYELSDGSIVTINN